MLRTLTESTRPGREIRESLAQTFARSSGPAFYQLMARLEAAGLVAGWYEQGSVGGQAVMERHYQITVAGQLAYQRVCDFYLEALSGKTLLSSAS